MASRGRVVVAMSGGVDSSVAAAMLKEQGYDVIGIMLRLWSEPGKEGSNRCCTPDAMALARRVAARLNIPFYSIDAQDIFHDTVVSYFINGYNSGITPNPCLVCNRQIRFRFLLDRALALGADFLATGHYARILQDEDQRIHLLRGRDRQKDQSYVLHVLTQEQLKHTLLPIGEYTKPQVREIARLYNLPIAERPDSQDLCFLAGEDYRQFLLRNSPSASVPGLMVSSGGKVIGRHQGLAFYTIGQRKGLGISSLIPMYVIKKDIRNNVLVVGTAEELGQGVFMTEKVNWVSGDLPVVKLRVQVKIRYKAQDSWAIVLPLNEDRAKISLDEPLRDITPGQAAVFYDDEECLGGGIISAESEP
jgi:tRNA-specific 2-thiouridylase